MTHVIEQRPVDAVDRAAAAQHLFQVWIDLGEPDSPDWWWNSPPQPLSAALDECSECRAGGWTAKVMPEGMNPRADGRWDNP